MPVLKKDFHSTSFHFSAPDGYPDAWRTSRRWSLAEESPFERQRVLNPAPNMAMIAKVQDHFAAAFPAHKSVGGAGKGFTSAVRRHHMRLGEGDRHLRLEDQIDTAGQRRLAFPQTQTLTGIMQGHQR